MGGQPGSPTFQSYKLMAETKNAEALGENTKALVDTIMSQQEHADELVKATKGLKTATWVLAAVAALQGIIMLLTYFLP